MSLGQQYPNPYRVDKCPSCLERGHKARVQQETALEQVQRAEKGIIQLVRQSDP